MAPEGSRTAREARHSKGQGNRASSDDPQERSRDMTEGIAFDRITAEIEGSDIVLFMKGTPQFPQCGFSATVAAVLSHLGVPFKGVNVLEDDDLRQRIKEFSSWPTIPQLYVGGEFIGGCDIVREMYESGELQRLLSEKGIAGRSEN